MTVRTIYVLRDPDSGEYRYVGATQQPLVRRLNAHMFRSKWQKHACALWVRELLSKGKRPVIEAIQMNCLDWQEAERFAIKTLKANHFDLLNQTQGGIGVKGFVATDETNQRRARSLKNLYASNPQKAKERRAILEEARKHMLTPEARKKASLRMKALWADPVKALEMKTAMQGGRSVGGQSSPR